MNVITQEQALFMDISTLIEQARHVIATHANGVAVSTCWRIGERINADILQNQRAEYGKQIVSQAATQLSWSHIIEILPLKNTDAQLYYLGEAARYHLGRNALRNMISRKAYERKEIANSQITDPNKIPMNTFKDPFLFDMMGLKDDYLEADLESAILRELEKFILEFGKGFRLLNARNV